LKFDVYLSDKISELVDIEKNKFSGFENFYHVLFLSQTTTHLFSDPLNDEIDTINTFLSRTEKENILFLIKFHPKDSEEKKNALRTYFNNSRFKSIEIFPDVTLPIEVLFSKIKIDLLIGYFSSTQLYAKQILPDTPVISLLPNLLAMYKQKNINNQSVKDILQNYNKKYVQFLKKNRLKELQVKKK